MIVQARRLTGGTPRNDCNSGCLSDRFLGHFMGQRKTGKSGTPDLVMKFQSDAHGAAGQD
jgi:hypothetical protein